MTELERHSLLMGTKVGEMISPEFDTWLLEQGFYNAPASTKYHGSYAGGLFDHSFAVMNFLVELSAKNNLKWKRAESPFIVGIFHDLCKIDQYNLIDTDKYEFNVETLYKGHGTKSVLLLSQHMGLTDEEVACICYHMGAYTEKEDWNYYNRAVSLYPNVLWTHHADMLASHVMGL